MTKIRVRPQPRSPDLDHIELVFEDLAGHIDAVDLEDPAVSTGAKSTSVLSGLETVRKGRGSWTFPLDLDERHLPMDVELESRSSARERLLPKVHLADGERGDMVCVNSAYS